MGKSFRRINYYKGLFLQAEDLQHAEQYHIEKRKLHNQYLHTPGIVRGCLGELKVTAAQEGTAIAVADGCALDGSGSELYLPDSITVRLESKNITLPATVYITIAYGEKKDDLRPDKANPEYTDYAFIAEQPRVEVVSTEPDNKKAIELARIEWKTDHAAIKNPNNPDSPKVNEIDRRFIQFAAAIIQPPRLADYGTTIKDEEITVIPEEDSKVLLEAIENQERQPFYVTSVYPLEEGQITWQIVAEADKKQVYYRLLFHNSAEKATKVRYRVFRLM